MEIHAVISQYGRYDALILIVRKIFTLRNIPIAKGHDSNLRSDRLRAWDAPVVHLGTGQILPPLHTLKELAAHRASIHYVSIVPYSRL